MRKHRVVERASRLAVLAGLMLALALVLPEGAAAEALGQAAKLTASDAAAGDFFGRAVSVSGDTVVVGASWNDAAGTEAGAAYVYERDAGGTWSEITKLTPANLEANDRFGVSVGVSGDTIVVGAYRDDTEGSEAGAAYVFQRDQGGPGAWGEVTMLTASDATTGDFFGDSVAVSGDTIVVGARREDSGGLWAGAAYVFQRDEGGPDAWGEVRKLTASDAEVDDLYGESVAISGDTIVVGSRSEDHDGSEHDNYGAAYVYERAHPVLDHWGEVAKLTASDAEQYDAFGVSVAVAADTIVVGAIGEDAGGFDAGAAYVFDRDAGGDGAWGEVRKLTASDAESLDQFGQDVAISDAAILVGARFWEPDEGCCADAGAAYVFARDAGGAGNWGEAATLGAADAGEGDGFGQGVAFDGDTAAVGASGEDEGGSDAGAVYIFVKGAPPVVLAGDASCDGTVNAIDAALVLQYVAALLDPLPCPAAADANVDGTANALDAALIMQYVAGLIGSLPP